ncbi:hypothetical protein MDAP_001088 [Mitosporidium daphniae]
MSMIGDRNIQTYVRHFLSNIFPYSSRRTTKKGECGRYCLQKGADLVYLFTSASASAAIKASSPDIITIPLLPSDEKISKGKLHEFHKFSSRFDALIVGPGLTRSQTSLANLVLLLECCKKRKIPLVIDADALFIVKEKYLELASTFGDIILTPNSRELEHLLEEFELEDPLQLGKRLGPNFYILCKGEKDILISDQDFHVTICGEMGSIRRCGGQGDILSGVLGTFCAWVFSSSLTSVPRSPLHIGSGIVTASLLVRTCASLAFQKRAQSMLASDMIENLSESYRLLQA